MKSKAPLVKLTSTTTDRVQVSDPTRNLLIEDGILKRYNVDNSGTERTLVVKQKKNAPIYMKELHNCSIGHLGAEKALLKPS